MKDLRDLEPTPVLDSFWQFAVERQAIMFRRLGGDKPPWTTDPILKEHRFTNAYRAADRVSQYLIRHILYAPNATDEVDDQFFQLMLFKLFNKIETWELLSNTIGRPSLRTYDRAVYAETLAGALERGERIYSAAYIMPMGLRDPGLRRKHESHLALVERMIDESVPARLVAAGSLAQGVEILRSYEGIGSFLGYQLAIDINYSEMVNWDENEFVMPGPGARDGIRKCFRRVTGRSDADIIRLVADAQDEEFARRGLAFQTLWGRPLQLIDVQNLFCEIGKYARKRHPGVTGTTDRIRIKQKFHPSRNLPEPWFPPKWGLNGPIAVWQRDCGVKSTKRGRIA